MDEIIQEGKNVQEAIAKALNELGLPRERVDIEVLEEGSRGIFGLISGKTARIKARRKKEKKEIARDFVSGICDRMGTEVQVNITEENENPRQVILEIEGENLGLLIGKRGQTIDALQYLTTLVANRKKEEDYLRVIIDAEDYRNRREKTLEALAKRMAEKAARNGRKVLLEPMSPQERRIIHMTLKDDRRVKTYSQGEEPFRKVCIEPN